MDTTKNKASTSVDLSTKSATDACQLVFSWEMELAILLQVGVYYVCQSFFNHSPLLLYHVSAQSADVLLVKVSRTASNDLQTYCQRNHVEYSPVKDFFQIRHEVSRCIEVQEKFGSLDEGSCSERNHRKNSSPCLEVVVAVALSMGVFLIGCRIRGIY